MDEFRLIRAIAARLGPARADPRVLLGIGDDAAVLAPTGRVVATTDTLVEGVHFRLDWMSPSDAGRRAVAVNLSDLAAMAARPLALLLALEIPRAMNDRDVLAFASGVGAACHEACVAVVGGNVTSTPGPFAACVTALGEVTGRWLPRSGARPGDAIHLSGPVGSAALGRAALASGPGMAASRWPALVRAYRRPRARLDLVSALAGDAGVHALIDVSDGLLADLGHVLDASGVGAVLDLDAIPILSQARRFAAAAGADPYEAALAGGDDYELLAFGDPEALVWTAKAFVRVGHVTRRRGLRLVRGGTSVLPPARKGWLHRE